MTTAQLNTQANLDRPDDFYQALIDAHRGLSSVQSQALNARLLLLLANHIGVQTVLVQALEAARQGRSEPDEDSGRHTG